MYYSKTMTFGGQQPSTGHSETRTKAEEQVPRSAKTGINRGQFIKGNTFGSSSAAILGRKRKRMEKEFDASNDTAPFHITPLILGAKRKRKTPMTLSQEPLRDCAREPQSQKREQIGFEKMKKMKAGGETATKTRTAAAYATKLKLARQGLTCFGPMELLLFQKKVEDRFGTIMPALLNISHVVLESCTTASQYSTSCLG